jgi:ligand-binding sensor domain-containing protein
MTLKEIPLILLFSIFIAFSSCIRSDNAKNKKVQKNASPIGELVSEIDTRTWSVYQDQAGNYWFGTNGDGVIIYDGKQLKRYTEQDGLVNNTIRGIQGDHLGNVFIETPQGVSKYDGNSFTSLKFDPSSSNKWALEPTDLWFNCNGNANEIYRYDGEFLSELQLPRMDLEKAFGFGVQGLSFKDMNSSPYSVFGIDKDKAGNLWIGTVVAGAFRYDGTSFLWVGEKELSTLPDGRVPGVRSILEDKDGNIWLSNFISKYNISTEDSVAQYEKLVGINELEELVFNEISYFNSGLADKNGDLWMTTYTGGVWKYDGEKLSHFPVKKGKTEVQLISIYEDNQGMLWLGSDNDGVYKFNGQTFEKFEPMKK